LAQRTFLGFLGRSRLFHASGGIFSLLEDWGFDGVGEGVVFVLVSEEGISLFLLCLFIGRTRKEKEGKEFKSRGW